MSAQFDGLALRRGLKRAGIRQAEFAKAIGVSQGMVSKFISGKRKPTAEMVQAINAAMAAKGASMAPDEEVRLSVAEVNKAIEAAQACVLALSGLIAALLKAASEEPKP